MQKHGWSITDELHDNVHYNKSYMGNIKWLYDNSRPNEGKSQENKKEYIVLERSL